MSRNDLQDLPMQWRAAPRRWGHPLHSLCSYFAMFPPQLAHFFINWLTVPGETIYDPFSGRGTVPLEALLQGRRGYGSDANPLAALLSHAKTRVPSKRVLLKRLANIEAAYSPRKVSLEHEPAYIAMLYSEVTLKQIIWLKGQLDQTSDTDCFWIAVILGMLHANHNKSGEPRGFSLSMPNTFAMAPGYVERYIKENGLVRPDVDVFAMLRARIERLELPPGKRNGGKAWNQDATTPVPSWLVRQRPKLIFTSPPYLQVIKYGKYNWVRLWFLDQTPKAVDHDLMTSASLPRYLNFMHSVAANLKHAAAEDGYVCLVIGDVRRENEDINLGQTVWDQVLQPQGWYLHGIVADEIPQARKVSRIWKNNSGRATKVDRLLLLSPTPTQLPEAVSPCWDTPISLVANATESLR